MIKLKNLIQNFYPHDEQEKLDKQFMLSALSNLTFPLSRECKFAHFTATAFVLNRQHNKVAMCYHIIDDSWALLGGHADGCSDLLSVALREVQEESGLIYVYPLSSLPITLVCNPVKGHIKNGKYVSSHIHMDLIFLFEADEVDLTSKPDENLGVKWMSKDEIISNVQDKWRLNTVYKKLIESYMK